jgi:hypothetical protein
MFMRHIGHGVGHQLYGMRQEVKTEMGSEGNDNLDDTKIDPNDINDDEESEGEESEEELASGDNNDLESESESDSGDNSEGCGSDDLGYASF